MLALQLAQVVAYAEVLMADGARLVEERLQLLLVALEARHAPDWVRESSQVGSGSIG